MNSLLNMNNDLVQYVLNNDESENTTTICQQLYDLARLANHPLKPEEMTAFVARSNKILSNSDEIISDLPQARETPSGWRGEITNLMQSVFAFPNLLTDL